MVSTSSPDVGLESFAFNAFLVVLDDPLFREPHLVLVVVLESLLGRFREQSLH